MIITLRQQDKEHDVNRLHDAFIRAGIAPERVESSNGTSTFVLPIGIPQSVVDSILASYKYVAPEPPPDLEKLKDGVRKAKTPGDRKQALLELLAAEKGLPLGKEEKEGLPTEIILYSKTSAGEVVPVARLRAVWDEKSHATKRASLAIDLTDFEGKYVEAERLHLP